MEVIVFAERGVAPILNRGRWPQNGGVNSALADGVILQPSRGDGTEDMGVSMGWWFHASNPGSAALCRILRRSKRSHAQSACLRMPRRPCALRMTASRSAQWAAQPDVSILRTMSSPSRNAPNPAPSQIRPIAAGVSVGHVHLKVADLERAIAFYRDVLGFEVTDRFGRQAAFLSAGGYHHHIGLNTWESRGGQPPAPGTTGLFHAAILYPARADLADALRRLLAHGIRIDGASDHGVSEAIYLRDPDGNGLELYWDRPRRQWPRNANGSLAMSTDALDLDSLLTEH